MIAVMVNTLLTCFYLIGFVFDRRDRSVFGTIYRGGGICIYIRYNLNFIERHDPTSETLENLIVEIKKPLNQSW